MSLTSAICKLLERLIKDHLVDFIVKNNLVNPSQHGFLKTRSCLPNILCFLEDVTKWIDEGSPCAIDTLPLIVFVVRMHTVYDDNRLSLPTDRDDRQ